ncbi:hypothetical protein EVAR_98224_1 [Eumeta japonica]|uniref:Uncharacterized protein n=1 Tax=Eumeta variegata TaxID=151549 RepID=A0A4C1Y6W2_EUMVA|nr:hypothetical protein EVAR_98224_1 [Eumeta japonica]
MSASHLRAQVECHSRCVMPRGVTRIQEFTLFASSFWVPLLGPHQNMNEVEQLPHHVDRLSLEDIVPEVAVRGLRGIASAGTSQVSRDMTQFIQIACPAVHIKGGDRGLSLCRAAGRPLTSK